MQISEDVLVSWWLIFRGGWKSVWNPTKKKSLLFSWRLFLGDDSSQQNMFFSMNDPITFSLISTRHEKQIVFGPAVWCRNGGLMVVLNAPGKYQYDLRNHLLVNLFPIALDAAITTSNVNNHELHRNNIPATLSGNSGITDYVPPGSDYESTGV